MSEMPEILKAFFERIKDVERPKTWHLSDGRLCPEKCFGWVLKATELMTQEEFLAMVVWSNERE